LNLSFIIVEPSRPGNVGSAARAIKTMGFASLRLVNPCDHMSTDAKKLAYGSHDVLQSSEVFDSLSDAIQDLDLVIATTAKNRTVWNDYLTPSQCVDLLRKKGESVQKVGIVFGREESGLTTSELDLCDIRSTVPLSAPYPSINLAQSVMIYAYEFSRLGHSQKDQESIDLSEQKVLKDTAQAILNKLDITRNTNLSRRMIERLMLANKDDIHLFLSFHQFLNRYLDKNED